MPVVERMHMHLRQLPVIHADEKSVQVLNERNRKNATKSFMWVLTNGEYEVKWQIRIYEYHPGRNGSFAVVIHPQRIREDFL